MAAKKEADSKSKASDALLLGNEEVEAEAEGRELDHEQQARLLAEYKLTGINRGYIDQSRDQEPDIGQAFGQAPHPELFNPEPHEDSVALGANGGQGGLAGIGQKSDSPLVSPDVEAEQERAEAVVEAEKARAEGLKVVSLGNAQPVVVVADVSKDNEEK